MAEHSGGANRRNQGSPPHGAFWHVAGCVSNRVLEMDRRCSWSIARGESQSGPRNVGCTRASFSAVRSHAAVSDRCARCIRCHGFVCDTMPCEVVHAPAPGRNPCALPCKNPDARRRMLARLTMRSRSPPAACEITEERGSGFPVFHENLTFQHDIEEPMAYSAGPGWRLPVAGDASPAAELKGYERHDIEDLASCRAIGLARGVPASCLRCSGQWRLRSLFSEVAACSGDQPLDARYPDWAARSGPRITQKKPPF